ncbi:hypothetical protein [Bacillus xiapuensis]|uniref:hypothetical protein n=1 Tax=Bacillus xiapuensis TaxID=2014075 RepID=UPI000C23AE47|nr:hypothetical protein [Bacillus xiapuensis]
MGYYLTFIIQFMVWSLYTLASWLSQGDRIGFRWLLFALFFYFCAWIAKKLVNTNKRSIMLTVIIAVTYFSFRLFFIFICYLI